MSAPDGLGPCLVLRAISRHAVGADVDLSHAPRPRAVRSRVRQAMTELGLALRERPSVRSVVVVVRTGSRPATSREWGCTMAAADDLHRRSEMLRGEPLALAVVFADDTTPDELLERCVSGEAGRIPDGVAGMTWIEACTRGIPACAASARI